MLLLLSLSITLLALFAFHLYRRSTNDLVSKVRGPAATTWYGPALDFMRMPVGDADFPWLEKYGSIIRVPVPLTLGVGQSPYLFYSTHTMIFLQLGDILLVADPKALRHMHQTAFKDFGPNSLRHVVLDLMTGQGIATAQGQQHVRQQRVIQPGFAAGDIKAQIPKFSSFAAKLAEKWADLIAADSGTSTVIDVTEWNVKYTLDCMGVAVLDYEFGALDGKDDPLMKACQNSEDIMVETMGSMVEGGVISMSISKLIPSWVYKLLLDYSWSEKIRRVRYARDLCTSFAGRLVHEKTAALMEGRQHKDTMSLIIKANRSEDAKSRLRDDELLAQVRTFLFAANSTLAHTMHWLLYELARHPEHQQRLKDEVRGKQAQTTNLDLLPFLNAIVKETLRFHPVAFMVVQSPKVDTVLPLWQPITLTTGQVVDKLPIPKGQTIFSSLSGYNRLKSVWGEDAHLFNPDRWLHDDTKPKPTGFGMHANLASFLGGPKGCTGWRMAVVVLQVFTFEMASKFKFSQTEDTRKVRRETSVFMLPKIEGQPERGICLPLAIEVDDD